MADGSERAHPVGSMTVGGVARTKDLMEAAGSEERLEGSRQLILTVWNVEITEHKDQLQRKR